MEKIMNKFGRLVIYLIAFAIFFIPTLLTIFGSMSEETSTNIFLNTSYIFFVIVIIAIIVGGVVEIAGDPKSSLKTIFGLVGILVLGAIAFGVSNNEVTEMYTRMGVDKFMSQFVESTLVLSYWLMLIAFLAILVTEIRATLS